MTNLKIFQQNFNDENSSATIYQALSEIEKDARLAEVYRRLGETERKHANHWAELIQKQTGSAPVYRPDWRTTVLLWLGRRFGPGMILPSVQNMERKGTTGYAQQSAGDGATHLMARQERSHDRLLSQIVNSVGGGMEGAQVATLEGRHRSAGGNALRAAVLGANDGLVSNLSLVMGVAGAALSNRAVLITGLAGLLAGAISMALGEWLSVESSRELYKHQIQIETAEVENAPEEETEELALIYEARGLPPNEARTVASRIMEDQAVAIDTLAREELGIDPNELGGSAWEAALTSFFLFAIGAIIPVAPFILFTGMTAVYTSVAFSAVGLFILGAAITLFTGRSVWFSGPRQVIFGLIAAAVTFGIGRLFGANIGG